MNNVNVITLRQQSLHIYQMRTEIHTKAITTEKNPMQPLFLYILMWYYINIDSIIRSRIFTAYYNLNQTGKWVALQKLDKHHRNYLQWKPWLNRKKIYSSVKQIGMSRVDTTLGRFATILN